jgi:hypothetical protein
VHFTNSVSSRFRRNPKCKMLTFPQTKKRQTVFILVRSSKFGQRMRMNSLGHCSASLFLELVVNTILERASRGARGCRIPYSKSGIIILSEKPRISEEIMPAFFLYAPYFAQGSLFPETARTSAADQSDTAKCGWHCKCESIPPLQSSRSTNETSRKVVENNQLIRATDFHLETTKNRNCLSSSILPSNGMAVIYRRARPSSQSSHPWSHNYLLSHF